jgi:exonuclease III
MLIPHCRIVTLNANGLIDHTRRRHIFLFLRRLDPDIVCLQETHTPENAATFWTSQWQGPAVWTCHTGILLARRHQLHHSTTSHQGRLLQAEVTVNGCRFSLLNIYAPADPPARRQFFDQLAQTPFDPVEISFIAGDWNTYPDSRRDRHPPLPSQDRHHWTRLAPAIASFEDAAMLGADAPYFTFHARSQSHSARLDHIFASSLLTAAEYNTSVQPGADSDHDALVLDVAPPHFKRPIFW